MKLGVLFSGGKDSTYAAYLAKKQGHELACLITVHSENKASYMFHTPSISQTKVQAEAINLPLIEEHTAGIKEIELQDLIRAIKKAIDLYHIEGITTGAVASVYQASRIQKICDDLNIRCINPLWQFKEFELLESLIKDNFKVIIVAVAAYPLDEKWLLRPIDQSFIADLKPLHEKYKIHPAGEGGEFESLVLDCQLFSHPLKVLSYEILSEKDAHRVEVVIG